MEDERRLRDIEDLFLRIRELESLDTPATRALVRQVAELQERVNRINEQGALFTSGELRRLDDRLQDLRDDIHRLEQASQAQSDEGRQLRRGLLIALVAAALSLGGSLILYAVARAG